MAAFGKMYRHAVALPLRTGSGPAESAAVTTAADAGGPEYTANYAAPPRAEAAPQPMRQIAPRPRSPGVDTAQFGLPWKVDFRFACDREAPLRVVHWEPTLVASVPSRAVRRATLLALDDTVDGRRWSDDSGPHMTFPETMGGLAAGDGIPGR